MERQNPPYKILPFYLRGKLVTGTSPSVSLASVVQSATCSCKGGWKVWHHSYRSEALKIWPRQLPVAKWSVSPWHSPGYLNMQLIPFQAEDIGLPASPWSTFPKKTLCCRVVR